MKVDTGNSVQEINKVKSGLSGLGDTVEQQTSNAKQLQASLQFGSAIVGGIGAVQGAMSLLGIQNEKAIKTVQRLMSLQAIASGLQQGANLLVAQNTTLVKIQTFVTEAYNKVLTMSKIAQAGLMVGVTALIGGLFWLVKRYNESTEASQRYEQAIKNNTERLKELGKVIDDNRRKISIADQEKQILLLKEQGASVEAIKKAETDLATLKKLYLSQDIEGLNEQISKQNKLVETRKADIKSLETFGMNVLEQQKFMSGQMTQQEQAMLIKAKDFRITAMQDGLIAEEKMLQEFQLKKLELEKEGLELTISTIDQINTKDAEKKKEEALQRSIDLSRTIRDKELELKEESRQKDLEMEQNRQQDEREKLIEQFGFDTKMLEVLEDQRRQALEEVNKKWDDIEKERLQKGQKMKADLFFATSRKIYEDQQKRHEEQLRNYDAFINATAMVGQTVTDILIMTDREGKKSEQYRRTLTALQIATDTASAISSAVKTGMMVGVTPIEKSLAIAGNIAVVMLNMAKANQMLQQSANIPDRESSGSRTPTMSFGGGSSFSSTSITGQTGGSSSSGSQSSSSQEGSTQIVLPIESVTSMQKDMKFVKAISSL